MRPPYCLPDKPRPWHPLDAFARKKGSLWGDGLALVLLAILCWWLWRGAARLPAYQWNWTLLGEFVIRRGASGKLEAGLLLQGLFTTLRVGIWTFAFGLLAGALAGVFFAGKRGVAALPYRVFVNIIRNTPPLVLLFCVYFFAGNILPTAVLDDFARGLPPLLREGLAAVYAQSGQMDRMTAAVLALGIYQAAYTAEIVRAGVESVNAGQWDAALALGFSKRQAMRLVIMPQALKITVPPLAGQAISAIKDSALASLISLPDMTFLSLEIMAVSGMTFEIWTSCGMLYLLLGGLCALLGRRLEKSLP